MGPATNRYRHILLHGIARMFGKGWKHDERVAQVLCYVVARFVKYVCQYLALQ